MGRQLLVCQVFQFRRDMGDSSPLRVRVSGEESGTKGVITTTRLKVDTTTTLWKVSQHLLCVLVLRAYCKVTRR